MSRTICLFLVLIGSIVSLKGDVFGQDPVIPPGTTRRVYKIPQRSRKLPPAIRTDAPPQSQSGSPTAQPAAVQPGAARPATTNASPADPVFELRSEIQRLQSEVDQLKRRTPGAPAPETAGPAEPSDAVFERPRNGPPGGEAAPSVLFSNSDPLGGDPLEGDPFDEASLDSIRQSGIQQVQYDDFSSEFGAVPSQRIRPRDVDQLGTITLPPMPDNIPKLPSKNRKASVEFGDGLTFKTDDNYFSLTFHNLTQVDYRGFVPSGDPLHSQFIIPRQRWYFVGNISPYVRYYTVISRGYSSLDLLEAWTDWKIGDIDRDKLQIRIGRMKTPYSYEWIKMAAPDLIGNERSVFINNMGTNRQIGIMAHGELMSKKFEYAIGLFNGARHSFEDYNSGKDLFTFVNTKPFLDGDNELLEQLNLSGSWNWGNEHNAALPFALRTANNLSGSAAAATSSPTFFNFAPNVFESGTRMQWSGDVAWYYKSVGLIAGYQGGFQEYAIAGKAPPSVKEIQLGTQAFVGVNGNGATRVPMEGYSATVFWFLTGEEVIRRGTPVDPKNDYEGARVLEGKFGALELFSRYSFMKLGENVFTAGLADPAVSSNRADVFDNGVNWYLNRYTKVTFEWQYAAYGSPVFLSPSRNTSYNNLFWLRTQVFF